MKRKEFWFGHVEYEVPLKKIQENVMNNHLNVRGVAWAGDTNVWVICKCYSWCEQVDLDEIAEGERIR